MPKNSTDTAENGAIETGSGDTGSVENGTVSIGSGDEGSVVTITAAAFSAETGTAETDTIEAENVVLKAAPEDVRDKLKVEFEADIDALRNEGTRLNSVAQIAQDLLGKMFAYSIANYGTVSRLPQEELEKNVTLALAQAEVFYDTVNESSRQLQTRATMAEREFQINLALLG